jgi:hypothetical protein
VALEGNMSRRTYSARLYWVTVFKIECEACGHVYAFKRFHVVSNSGVFSEKSALKDVNKKLTNEVAALKAARETNRLGVPPYRCPECDYCQSYMISGDKFYTAWGRAANLGVAAILLAVGAALVVALGWAVPPALLVAVVAGAAILWGGYLVYQYLNYDPNAGRDEGRTLQPQVKFRMAYSEERHVVADVRMDFRPISRGNLALTMASEKPERISPEEFDATIEDV